MDGTLVDTEPYWMDAETDLIESFGGTWTTSRLCSWSATA
jgi:beta-phosphoglucomutase-like phosphatase (HAD superfamily)